MSRSTILSFLIFSLLAAGRASALDASFPAAWSGGSGTTDSFLVPDADRPPYELFEQGLTGRVSVLFLPPGKKAPDGAYSGSITILDAGVVKVFRGSGTPGPDGSIDAPWIADGNVAGSAQIKLRPVATDPQALVLHGDVTIGSRKYPLFLVPQTYSRAAPYAGSATVPGPGNYNFFLVHPFREIGSGSGSAIVAAAGTVRFAGALPDGSRIAAAVPVLATAGRHFLLVAVPVGKGGGFLGGWADGDRSRPDSDWRGAAITSMPGLGVDQEIAFSLSSFLPSTASSPISWRKGLMQIEYEKYFFVANGRVDFDGRGRFTAEPRIAGVQDGILNLANASAVRLVSLTMDLRRGVVAGQIKFFEEGVTLTGNLAGALNQKSGVVQGRVLPVIEGDKPGFFDIIAAPAPTITGFAPSSAPVDTSIFISGTGFTGATAVTFNGVPAASFTVNSATQIAATVPAGATTGKISVTTPSVVLTTAEDFTVFVP